MQQRIESEYTLIEGDFADLALSLLLKGRVRDKHRLWMNMVSQREAQNPSYLLWCAHCLFKPVFPYQQGIRAKTGSEVQKETGLVERNPPAVPGGLRDGEGAGGGSHCWQRRPVINGGGAWPLVLFERRLLISAVTGGNS